MSISRRPVCVLGVLVVLAGLVPLQTALAQGNGKQSTASPSAPGNAAPAAPIQGGTVDVTTFVLGPGDYIGVKVFLHPELSDSHAIRPDGIISIPLMGEIQAAGLTPQKLSRQIEQALSETIQSPVVTVEVLGIQSKTFTITGAMTRTGTFPMPNPINVFEAINQGGSFNLYAKKNKIKVFRTKPDGTQEILYFNYEDYTKGKNLKKNPNFPMQHKDTILVEE